MAKAASEIALPLPLSLFKQGLLKMHRVPGHLLLAMSIAAIQLNAHAAVHISDAGDNGHVTVPAYVNGRGPFPFIVDTGAEESTVYEWFVVQQSLPLAEHTDELTGMTGTTSARMSKISSLQMDGHAIHGLTLDVMPNRRDKGRQAGVLGNDFLDGTVTTFDYACGRIEVHPKPVDIKSIVGDDRPPVQATRAGSTNLLQLPVRVRGVSGTALLDTGSRTSKLSLSYARLAKIDPTSPQFHDEAPLFGANIHAMVPRGGPIGEVEFDGLELPQVHAQVIDLPIMKEMYGTKPIFWMGADLLNSVRLIYDHEANHVWFRQSSCTHEELKESQPQSPADHG